jgi:regulation of enolase protein 1 (concanavalin A-like superfamily)
MLVSAMIAALVIGFQAAGSDTAPWHTFVSKEGQFVVDFPTEPTSNSTSTENGPGGRMKIVVVVCDTPSVAYIAQKVTLPTAVLKGAEGQSLTSFRDYIAKKFKGKVVSEKVVRFEGNKPGLDFTVRVQPAPGQAGMLRVREYLSGQSIYILIAASVINRELPDDIGRFFGSFAIGTTRTKKAGPKADVPGTEIAGWGTAIDSDGDCQITPDGKTLTMAMPGTLHDLNADIDKYNAPRVLRDVEGDFEITVKVVGDFKPGTQATRKGTLPYNGAGIVVWRDSDNFIRLERSATFNKGKVNTFAIFEEREGGSRGAVHNGPLTPGTAFLRIARRGSRIFGLTSKDGQHWTQLKPIDTVWPSEVKIGINAINSSNEPFTVRFENLSIKTGRASSGGAASPAKKATRRQ